MFPSADADTVELPALAAPAGFDLRGLLSAIQAVAHAYDRETKRVAKRPQGLLGAGV
jgi:hypothetical protein